MEPREPSPQDFERQFLESIRSQFERDGYTFTVSPGPDQLPAFLASYRPDAIAKRPGQNIAIEIKQRQSASSEAGVQELRRLFEGHHDWQLKVFYAGSGPAQTIDLGSAPIGDLLAQVRHVEALNQAGEHRAAFVLAWALLEATLRSVDYGTIRSKARTPGTVVQTLAMNGYLDSELERRLRAMVEKRNRVVHGDLSVDVAPADVELVLGAVKTALVGAPAA